MWCATFAKCTATNIPAPHTAWKHHLHSLWTRCFRSIKANIKTKFMTSALQQTGRWLSEQFFTGPVHQPKSLLTVKCEHSNINFSHHGAQQGGRFHCAEALFAECLSEIVDLQHHFAKC